MADKIFVDYEVGVDGLKANLKTIKDEFKAAEKAGVDAGKHTGDAFEKVEEKTKSLKAQLRELKAQLANATDPKDIERLAKAAGKLTDQIEDASDAARVFASDSKFEQIGNAIGSIGGKLRNLDFKGAADQSKLLVSATKSLTFKEALGGVKDLGATLLNIGKSLLLNPIFLIGSAIGLIIANFEKLKNSGGVIGKMFTGIGEVISFVIASITSLTDAIGLTGSVLNSFAESNKKLFDDTKKYIEDINSAISKSVVSTLEGQGKISNAQARILGAQEDLANRLTAIDEERAVKIKEIEDRIDVEGASNIDTKLERQALLGKETAIINASFRARERAAQNAYDAITEGIYTEENNKKIQAEKELTAKLIAEAERLLALKKQAAIKAAEAFAKDNRERVAHLNAEELKAQQKLDEDKFAGLKAWDELSDEIDKSSRADRLQNAKDAAAREIEIEKQKQEEIKRLQAATFHFIGDLVSSLNQINQNKIESEIQGVNEVHDAEVNALDDQLKKKLITQDQYDVKKKAIDDRAQERERKLKQEAFESAKQASIITTLINTAQAIVKTLAETGYTPVGIALAGLAAVTGAVQIATIESQPTPKFAKGIVGIKGKGTTTSDEIPALLSVNESVITAEATSQYAGLLKAMNKNQAGNFIKEFYIAPALKAQKKKFDEEKEKSFASALLGSMSLNFKDGNLLDSLKQSRKNDREIALFLAKELKGNGYNARNW